MSGGNGGGEDLDIGRHTCHLEVEMSQLRSRLGLLERDFAMDIAEDRKAEAETKELLGKLSAEISRFSARVSEDLASLRVDMKVLAASMSKLTGGTSAT